MDRVGDQVSLQEQMRPLLVVFVLFIETMALASLVAVEVHGRTVVAVLATPATIGDFLAAKGLLTRDFNKWSMALLGGAALAFGLKTLLPKRYDDFVFALPYLGLFALDAICLFGFIVPYFR